MDLSPHHSDYLTTHVLLLLLSAILICQMLEGHSNPSIAGTCANLGCSVSLRELKSEGIKYYAIAAYVGGW